MRLSLLGNAILAIAFSSTAFASDCLVTNNNDSGSGSLRDCIDNVATDAGDVVTFDPSVTSPISLTSGELVVPNSIAIEGLGDGVTVIDGSGNGGSRVLHINGSDIFVSITGVTIRGADTTASSDEGAGIFIEDGDLTLANSKITGNKSPSGGGGIYLAAFNTLKLDDCVISDNRALAPSGGGGIYNDGGFLLIQGGEITGNQVAADAGFDDRGGGIFQDNNGEAEIQDALVQDNTADDDGGGILNNSGSLTVRSSRIDNNTSTNGRGGGIGNNGQLTISHCEVTNNDAGIAAGGVDHTSGNATVEDSLISGNTAVGDAGGLSTQSELTIRRTTVSDNIADTDSSGGNGGGGIDFSGGGIVMEDCLISGNKVLGATSEGGGINASGPDFLFVSNTTIFQNETGGSGGGLLILGSTFLNNVTIADNIAGDEGGGLLNEDRVQFANSIIAGNTAANAGPDCLDTTGGMASGGPNLIQDQTDCTFSGPAALSGDPSLGPLAGNGGPTQTLALRAGSPALDAGDDGSCETDDQRGTVRPQGAACDLGAFEAGPSADLSALQLVFDAQEIGVTSAAKTATLTNNGPIALTINGISLGGTDAADFAQTNDCGGTVVAGGTCNLSFTFTPSAVGVRQAEASVDTSANVQTIVLLGAGAEAGADTGGGTAGNGGDGGGGCSLIP